MYNESIYFYFIFLFINEKEKLMCGPNEFICDYSVLKKIDLFVDVTRDEMILNDAF